MEGELEKFRQKKIANERLQRLKENVWKSWDTVTTNVAAAVLPERDGGSDTEEEGEMEDPMAPSVPPQRKDRKKLKSKTSKDDVDAGNQSPLMQKQQNRTTTLILLSLKFLIWVLLYVGFIKIGFGAVFFAFSALWFIWANMNSGGGKRKRGRKSAYSIFNENCEAIDGSLNAELLEKHLLYRSPK